MKRLIMIILTLTAVNAFAQDKSNYVSYNKLTEIQGSCFVIATIENNSKMSTKSRHLLFINTLTGDSKQVDFLGDAWMEKIEHIRIDSLQINKVIIVGRTVDLDGNKSIDWNDSKQVIICSIDGTDKVQLTEDKFFVSTWIVNRYTGTIVITGHYDTNDNGKYDKKDKNEILLYDLKTMKLIRKI
jgi:hypothetical protein